MKEENRIKRMKRKTKTCRRCKTEKPIELFTVESRKLDGRHSRCLECNKTQQRDAYKKEPRRFYENSRKWIINNPEKQKAHKAIQRSIESGVIQKPKSCQGCGEEKVRLDAHHWMGYNKENQLNVKWLCRKCHKSADKK